MAEAGSTVDKSGPLEEVRGFSQLQSNDTLLSAAAKFLLKVGAELDAVVKSVEQTRESDAPSPAWKWTASDDSTATATQGPLWSARQLLHEGLAATGTAVERLQVETCALLSVRCTNPA